jgi:predicted RecA/RadA family phage recombinase
MAIYARYVSDDETVDYTPTADVAAGAVVVQGDLVGVAKLDIAANRLGALAVEGVFDVAKATGAGSGIAVGVNVYWDVADKQAKTDSETGANKLIGKTVRAAADADTTVRLRFVQ